MATQVSHPAATQPHVNKTILCSIHCHPPLPKTEEGGQQPDDREAAISAHILETGDISASVEQTVTFDALQYSCLTYSLSQKLALFSPDFTL